MAPTFSDRLSGLLPGRRDEGSSTVFIASSGESARSDWMFTSLHYVEEKVGDRVTLKPWTAAFKSGDITAERLIAHAKQVGAAIVVLTGDDVTESRGEEHPTPRDNLILEAGIFVSQLGLGRVLLLRERGAKLPSDLLGITLEEFDGADAKGEMGEVALRDLANRIAKFIERAIRDTELAEESAVTRAVKTTLERVEAEIAEVRAAITDGTKDKRGVQLPDPTNAYLDGVKEVKETFLTTTYLDSKFWTMNDIPAVEANQYLIHRLKEGGTAKRLIVLGRKRDLELKSQREMRRLLRSRQPETVDQMDREFAAFFNDNAKLIQEGFEVKVVFDQEEAFDGLPDAMNFRAGEDELALFDDERIDIYSGFTKKKGLPSARMFTDSTGGFEWIQKMTCEYFNSLWDSDQAVDFLDFGHELNGIIEDCKFEIDYERNWLLLYDRDADDGDAQLKRDELNWVLQVLKGKAPVSDPISHLDLGTCTGRYIEALRANLKIALSVGVDSDRDCTEHCRRVFTNPEGSEEVQIVDADIRALNGLVPERFEVITCMMGTLCHLRRLPSSRGDFEDPWQDGLQSLAARLADGGDAFVGIWNTENRSGGSARSILGIYPDRSREILLDQSPSVDEFEQRLTQAGLRLLSRRLVRNRLHAFHLTNA
jgi:predicted nucleotide-binding protein